MSDDTFAEKLEWFKWNEKPEVVLLIADSSQLISDGCHRARTALRSSSLRSTSRRRGTENCRKGSFSVVLCVLRVRSAPRRRRSGFGSQAAAVVVDVAPAHSPPRAGLSLRENHPRRSFSRSVGVGLGFRSSGSVVCSTLQPGHSRKA